MKNVPGVYILTFPTGVYVGSSKDIRRRVLRHIADLKRGDHSNGFMQSVFDRHGEPSCRIERECAVSELLVFEQEAIDRLKPRLNLAPTAGRNIGHRHSPETIALMRDGAKRGWENRPRTVADEQRALISASLSGRQFSPETRAKISEAKTGHVKSAESRAKISASKKGKRINQIGHPMTPEILAKIAATKAAKKREGKEA